MKKQLPLFLLIFAMTALGQSSLPDKSTLADIVGKSKAYVDVVDPSKGFKDAFKKGGLVEVGKADEADFVIEYRQIGNTEYITDFRIPLEKGSLTIYYFRDSKKVIVWQETASNSGRNPSPVEKLLKQFTKERAKVSK